MSEKMATALKIAGLEPIALAPKEGLALINGTQFSTAAALAGIPIGRMATPEEIGELTAFLFRPKQVSMNGAVLDVNGGSYLR